jgi:hypothetical protein
MAMRLIPSIMPIWRLYELQRWESQYLIYVKSFKKLLGTAPHKECNDN